MEGKDWEKYRKGLLAGYEWKVQETRRKNRKGRAMGEMILEIRKELAMREEEVEKKIEGMMKEK